MTGSNDLNDKGDGEDTTSANIYRPIRPNPNPISPSELLNRYNKLLDRYPLRTKMITSAVVSAFGSALGSFLSSSNTNNNNNKPSNNKRQSPSRINWVDVFSYAIHGGIINAPICHYWFEWLATNGPSSNTSSVLVDQLVVQPPLLVLMFVCLDVLRANIRASIGQFREANVVGKALSAAGPAVVDSWRFWPFAVYFTFKYLKKKHYTVALNLCSVAWTAYLAKGGGGGDAASD
ncbi:Mpv17/PMP22 family protein [Skeletonema marinoi]|uniref:Mpv17/PMP22 family protein n=1 Tax=Skeletonema marinoi TaxID=267567 RepID=A0AAD8YI44_9STRA|nr:Mpv17/PMP22 family protein [Skeletonema marinoi]